MKWIQDVSRSMSHTKFIHEQNSCHSHTRSSHTVHNKTNQKEKQNVCSAENILTNMKQ